MSMWILAFIVTAVWLLIGKGLRGLREEVRGGYGQSPGRAQDRITPESEARFRQCADMLRQALASGDDATITDVLNKASGLTAAYYPLERPFPQTENEIEYSALANRAAKVVLRHGQ